MAGRLNPGSSEFVWLAMPSPLRGEGWERVPNNYGKIMEHYFAHPPLHPLPSKGGEVRRPGEVMIPRRIL